MPQKTLILCTKKEGSKVSTSVKAAIGSTTLFTIIVISGTTVPNCCFSTEDTSETKDKANLIVPDRRVVKESQRFHDWVLSIDKGKVMISDIESDQSIRFETYLDRKNSRVQDMSNDINIEKIVSQTLDRNTDQMAIVTTSKGVDNSSIWVLNFNGSGRNSPSIGIKDHLVGDG